MSGFFHTLIELAQMRGHEKDNEAELRALLVRPLGFLPQAKIPLSQCSAYKVR